MSETFRVACVQLNSAREIAPNLEVIERLVREAREKDAQFIMLPENCSMLEPRRRLIFEKAAPEDSHPALGPMRALARETGAWLLVGSLTVQLAEGRVANRSYLLDPTGGIVARYDKIHMFDVDLADGESYRESKIFRPGEEAVVAPTPWGPLGLTVCYDLRFPYLHRALAKAGALYLTVPSAFTRFTGKAHWHVLLRARAIETGCFVFAPAQCGEHAEGRKTFGHSLIVGPWGEILAEGGDEPGVFTADIDPARVTEARKMVPSLQHDRDFAAAAAPVSEPEPAAGS